MIDVCIRNHTVWEFAFDCLKGDGRRHRVVNESPQEGPTVLSICRVVECVGCGAQYSVLTTVSCKAKAARATRRYSSAIASTETNHA